MPSAWPCTDDLLRSGRASREPEARHHLSASGTSCQSRGGCAAHPFIRERAWDVAAPAPEMRTGGAEAPPAVLRSPTIVSCDEPPEKILIGVKPALTNHEHRRRPYP